MFERFTERARQIPVLGIEEARKLGHETMEPEHILLGILREGEGLAARVLVDLGVEIERIRVLMGGEASPGPAPETKVPFSQATIRIFELALREALSLGHNYIGTEHVLLALIRDENNAVRLLTTQFASPKDAVIETIRTEVMRRLTGPSTAKSKTSQSDVLEASRKVVDRLLKALEAKPSHRRGDWAAALEELASTANITARYLRGK